MNVLVLTGRFGMGHFSAAKTLAEEICAQFDDVNVTVQDIFDYTIGTAADKLYSAYALLADKGAPIYNLYYKLGENQRGAVRPPFYHYFAAKLVQLMDAAQPDLIVSTLPFCSQLVSRYKEREHSDIPLITCITDVSSHREWINPHTNVYLVACDSIRQSLIEKGVSPERILISGIPVKEQFHSALRAPRTGKRLLIMGGGLGLLPKSRSFYQGLNDLKGVTTTIITGNNHELYQKLHGKYPHIEVVGYTDQVYSYMQQADVVISKPGGITLFETVFSELPILVFAPFLQQEVKNAGFIQKQQIGLVLPKKPQRCVAEIGRIMSDERQLRTLRQNVRRLKQSVDPQAIVKTVSQYRTGTYRPGQPAAVSYPAAAQWVAQ